MEKEDLLFNVYVIFKQPSINKNNSVVTAETLELCGLCAI